MIGPPPPFAADRDGPRPLGAVLRLALLGLLSASLFGCLAKRSAYDVPAVPLAAQYKNQSPASDKDQGAAPDKPLHSPLADDDTLIDWWRYFGNAELDGLVNRGLANNPDLRIATIRLAQVKVRADQAKGGLLPNISLPALAARQAPGGTVGTVPTAAASRAPQNSFQGSLRGEFRLDVWGEQSSLVESANLQLWRAAYERDNVQRNVVASVVSSYVEYAALNDRLRVARDTERVLGATLRTMQRRLDLGDATIGEFEQQKALVFGLRAAIPSMEQQREDALNSLAFLVGSVPGAIALSEQGLDSLSVPSVVPGLPSSLLLRRPDVRMAEARLLSADADIDVARTRILPPVDLSAQSGYSSNMLSQFFLPKFFFWSTVASVTTSIFDGGKREGEKKFSEAVYEEMVENYARTIYQAMREVEGALATVRLAGKRLEAQKEASEAARRGWEINTKAYAMGGADHLTLLESERNYHRYLDEFQRSQMEYLRGYTSLFLALGGGVKVAATVPGSGKRPGGAPTARAAAKGTGAAPRKAFSVDGVDLVASGTSLFGDNARAFWQVELPGLFHRNTVGAAWRDLRGRYPKEMEGRMVRPRLNGRIDDSLEGQEAWYRLYVGSFASPAEAQAFCQKMQANQERCRVVTAKGEEVASSAAPLGEPPAAPPPAGETPAPTPALPAVGPATAKATTEPNSPPPEVSKERIAHTIQLAAYSNLENAAIASSVWQYRGYDNYVAETRGSDGRLWYAVRTGVYAQRRDAALAAQQIRRKDEAPAVLVPTVLDASGGPVKIDISEVLASKAASDRPVLPEPPEAPERKLLPMAGSEVAATSPPIIPARPAAKGKAHYAVQLGAFASPENAEVSRKYWQGRGLEVVVAPLRDAEGRPWYGVRTGAFQQRREASSEALQLGRKEGVSAIVVAAVPALGAPPAVVEPPAAPAAAAPLAPPVVMVAAPAGLAPPPAPKVVPVLAARPASPKPPTLAKARPLFSIQLGVFASIENAAKAYAEWQLLGYEPYVCDIGQVAGQPRFAVRTGEYVDKRAAQSMVRTIERQEARRGLVVPARLDAGGRLSRIDVTPLLGNSSSVQSANLTGNDVR